MESINLLRALVNWRIQVRLGVNCGIDDDKQKTYYRQFLMQISEIYIAIKYTNACFAVSQTKQQSLYV